MIFEETPLKGAYVIEIERLEDSRGFFARTWCQREFESHKLNPRLVQCSLSFNKKNGTLRGMHYQVPPFAEDKLVRVTRGRIYDVIVDLRPDSDTFLRWFGIDLSQENRLALYVPPGFAHGFETTVDDTEVFYQMSEFHAPDHARGFRWDDPLVGVTWPEPITVISERDRAYANIHQDDFVGFCTNTLRSKE
jgi:dTDP-4-dehydrorhamnose 3,5-epimerase